MESETLLPLLAVTRVGLIYIILAQNFIFSANVSNNLPSSHKTCLGTWFFRHYWVNATLRVNLYDADIWWENLQCVFAIASAISIRVQC